MQIIVMDRADIPGADATPVAEVTVETQQLARECRDEDGANAVQLAVSWFCRNTADQSSS